MRTVPAPERVYVETAQGRVLRYAVGDPIPVVEAERLGLLPTSEAPQDAQGPVSGPSDSDAPNPPAPKKRPAKRSSRAHKQPVEDRAVHGPDNDRGDRPEGATE